MVSDRLRVLADSRQPTADSPMRCPICQNDFKPEESEAVPFCGERCRTIDLGRWLDEGYGLPSVPDPDDDEQPQPL